MKIKELNQRCGECDLIEHCGNAFGYCICTDSRFQEVEEEQYKKLAEQAEFKEFKKCEGCFEECMGCENVDEERDYICKQIADFVEKAITEPVKDKYSIQGKKIGYKEYSTLEELQKENLLDLDDEQTRELIQEGELLIEDNIGNELIIHRENSKVQKRTSMCTMWCKH